MPRLRGERKKKKRNTWKKKSRSTLDKRGTPFSPRPKKDSGGSDHVKRAQVRQGIASRTLSKRRGLFGKCREKETVNHYRAEKKKETTPFEVKKNRPETAAPKPTPCTKKKTSTAPNGGKKKGRGGKFSGGKQDNKRWREKGKMHREPYIHARKKKKRKERASAIGGKKTEKGRTSIPYGEKEIFVISLTK